MNCSMPRALAWGATFEALAPMLFGYPLFKGDNSNVFIFLVYLLIRK
ncbi:TPA: hypothetical protein L3G51_003236 [Escherichia coli]|nr:hypothetical protein [Escherichia coli]